AGTAARADGAVRGRRGRGVCRVSTLRGVDEGQRRPRHSWHTGFAARSVVAAAASAPAAVDTARKGPRAGRLAMLDARTRAYGLVAIGVPRPRAEPVARPGAGGRVGAWFRPAFARAVH